MRFRRSPAPRRGIALFLTLVVLSLIAVFLTEFSFETTLEVRSLQNSQSSFQARNAVKSLFKAVLVGLQGGQDGKMAEVDFFEQIAPLLQFAQGIQQGSGLGGLPLEEGAAPAGEVPPVSFLNPPDLTVIPEELVQYALPEFYASFADVTFYTPSIRPIDHLYNLNRVQSSGRTLEPERTKPDIQLTNQFLNLLNTDAYQSEEEGGYVFNDSLALGTYGRLFDWIDKDDSVFQSNYGGVTGNEIGYRGQAIEYPIKNGFLERVEEVFLLLPQAEPRLPDAFWLQHFTVYPVGDAWDPQQDAREVNARINVNLATSEEVEAFLNRFDQDTNYLSTLGGYDETAAGFFQKRTELAEALSTLRESTGGATQKDIDAKVGGIVSKGLASDYFTPFSYWYEIRLRAAVGGVTSEVRAVVSVERDNEGLVEPNSLTIHEFQLR